jgi:predicted Zn-dependent protease
MKRAVLLVGVALFAIGAKKKPKDPYALPGVSQMTAGDKQTGAKAHPEIMNEFGGAFEGSQTAYVRTVGQKIALQSGLSTAASDFTVTLLNSNVDNAFAIPGGYVYVTRQLMALMNNEAELASVLGHEVGHVAARHGNSRQKRATTGGLLATGATILGAVLGGNTGAQLGQQLGQRIGVGYISKFSRAQEYEADDLGVFYLAKAGYDTMASSTMLASLAAETALDGRVAGRDNKDVPKWAQSHPDPASRVSRAADRANYQVRAGASKGSATNRDAFLAALDGLLYDDDPKQGVIDGLNFKHPELRFMFTAPAGFSMNNTPANVQISGNTGQALFGGGAYTGDLNAYVNSVFKAFGDAQKVTLTPGSISKIDVNGIPSATAQAQTQGQSGALVVTVVAYEFAKDQAFHFVGITPAASSTALDTLYRSVRRLSAAEAAAIKPKRIDVVTVKSGDTIEKMAARMAYPTFQTERFTVLNALRPGASLQPGQKVKIVINGQ